MVTQDVWGWKVAGYLGLTSAGAGAFLITQLASVLGLQGSEAYDKAVATSLAAVVAGSLLILSHLGRPTRFFRAAARPMKAWESRGFWLLTSFAIAGVLEMATRSSTGQPFAAATMTALAVGLVLYGALMLRSFHTAAVWRTSAHAWFYVSSALFAGWGLLAGNPVLPPSAIRLEALALVLIVIELVALATLWPALRLSNAASRLEQPTAWVLLAGGVIPLATMIAGHALGAEVEFARIAGLAALGGVVVQRYAILRLGSRTRFLSLRAFST